ncbi:MAG: phosphoglycerate kinase [Elusimicrobia bacterium]|nr:phosphoglycerate kinase [Elusimicrobiota bacterium]
MTTAALNLKTLDQLDYKGKRVLLRVDYNVPLDGERVTDDARIRETLPTLKKLIDAGCRLVLIAHAGRPKGKPNPKYSLKPAASALEKLLGRPVAFAEDCVGPAADASVQALAPGQVLLLENLRFHPEEEANDAAFAKKLAAHGEVFVQEAFGALHRAHASTAAVAGLLPGAIGGLVARELEFLNRIAERPEHPYVAVLGGAKVSDKLLVARRLLEKVDVMLIGGGMAYTFLKAQGIGIGKSLLEADRLGDAREILDEARRRNVELLLPADHVAAPEFKADSPATITPAQEVPEGLMGLDIGPKSRQLFAASVAKAKTVFWNGPMGVFEMPAFAAGSKAMAESLAKATANGTTTVAGGGDSLAVLAQTGLASKMTHCSTGGGASLELLEGKLLPGLKALAG